MLRVQCSRTELCVSQFTFVILTVSYIVPVLFGVRHQEPKKEGEIQHQKKEVKPTLHFPPTELRQKKNAESSVPCSSWTLDMF